MSETVDEQRRQQANEDRLNRQIDVLEELLLVVRLRAEGLSATEISERTGRPLRTVERREQLLRTLLGRVGQRRTESRG